MSIDGKLIAGVSLLASVVEAGSFARAAERLDITPSGVSRAVSRLEARMGIRLLDRSTRSLALTAEGQRLYEQVTPLLADIERMADDVSGAAAAVRGRLHVDLDPFFARLFLSRHLAGLLERYPDLVLDLTTREVAGDLVKDRIDLAIRFGEPGVQSPVARKLLETRILTVASPAYLARHGRPAHPTGLTDHACILFRNPVTSRPFEWEFQRGNSRIVVPVSGRLTVSDVRTMIDACVDGAGVAQVMALDTGSLLAGGQLVDLFPDWPDERFPLYALYPSRQHPPAKVRAFLDFVMERVTAR
ncbi:MAG: LysR family transcriptional regulator [Gammaproteobacteria bacterium]